MKKMSKLLTAGMVLIPASLISVSAYAALGGTNSGGNTEIVLRSNYAHTPYRQRVELYANAGNIGSDSIRLINQSTGSTITQGPQGKGSLTYSVRPSSTTFYEAELVNSAGTVQATSALVGIGVSGNGNGTNMGYNSSTNGSIAEAINGLSSASSTQAPTVYVGWENIAGSVNDQFWVGNSKGWHGTGPEPAWGGTTVASIDSGFTGSPIGYGANGQWGTTAYAWDSANPDSKPYLAKAHTIWFYSSKKSYYTVYDHSTNTTTRHNNAGITWSSDVVNEGNSTTISFPTPLGGPYQIWLSPQDGHGRWSTMWTNTGSAVFNPTQMGGWKVVITESNSSYTYTYYGYLNVNQ